jgi:hypothetical protein
MCYGMSLGFVPGRIARASEEGDGLMHGFDTTAISF